MFKIKDITRINKLILFQFSGRISNVKSISSTNNTTSSLTSSSIRDLTSNRSSTGGSTATSMHLQTSKQEPLTSIVVIKTESGSISSGNLIGVSDEVRFSFRNAYGYITIAITTTVLQIIKKQLFLFRYFNRFVCVHRMTATRTTILT